MTPPTDAQSPAPPEPPDVLRHMKTRLNDSTLMHVTDTEREEIFAYIKKLESAAFPPSPVAQGENKELVERLRYLCQNLPVALQHKEDIKLFKDTITDAIHALSTPPAPEARPVDAGLVELNEIARAAYENSKAHGFWEQPRNKGEMLALIHSEVSECLEGVRKDLPDDHLPETNMEAAELADIIIRVGDYAHGFGVDLQKVVAAKMKFNASRPYKHGKNF